MVRMNVTPEMASERFDEVAKYYAWDVEDCHVKMDKLMLLILEQHGYQDFVKKFIAMDKWYA